MYIIRGKNSVNSALDRKEIIMIIDARNLNKGIQQNKALPTFDQEQAKELVHMLNRTKEKYYDIKQ